MKYIRGNVLFRRTEIRIYHSLYLCFSSSHSFNPFFFFTLKEAPANLFSLFFISSALPSIKKTSVYGTSRTRVARSAIQALLLLLPLAWKRFLFSFVSSFCPTVNYWLAEKVDEGVKEKFIEALYTRVLYSI